jgi:hypothetical protein
LVCFLSTIFVDFIFVDFDKILDKFIYLFGIFWGIILCRPCLTGTVEGFLDTLFTKSSKLEKWNWVDTLVYYQVCPCLGGSYDYYNSLQREFSVPYVSSPHSVILPWNKYKGSHTKAIFEFVYATFTLTYTMLFTYSSFKPCLTSS